MGSATGVAASTGRDQTGEQVRQANVGDRGEVGVADASSFLAARFKRICARRGYGKALVAVQDSMVIAIWHILSTGELYHDLGGDYYARRKPQQQLQRKIRELQAAGYRVDVAEPDTQAGAPTL